MTRKELISRINDYLDKCENAETWEDIRLVEEAQYLLSMASKFLKFDCIDDKKIKYIKENNGNITIN